MEVIVLAGGLGTRLRSVVGEVPKCLAPIGRSRPDGEGIPFLQYLLDWLENQGASHIIFSVGHLREQVISYVKGHARPFTYDFAIEETPLGTGGGIRLALGLCREEKVFVVNGDTFYPVDLHAMPFSHAITLALKPLKDFDRYGAVETEGDRVTAFREKRHCEEGLINGGVYAIDRSRLNLDSLPEKFSFEKEVLEPGAAVGEIGGWVNDAYFIDIGIPVDYGKAQWALPAWRALRKASEAVLESSAQTLFLDRDGVLNRHLPGDYVKDWKQWEWMPGILQEFPLWASRFRHIVLVTNQRGVGKGLMGNDDLSRIHARMMAGILEAGGRLDLVLTCTAISEEDPRRKPHTGMFREACALFPDIDAKSSVMLGDSPSDAAFAKNCGMQFILLNPEAVS